MVLKKQDYNISTQKEIPHGLLIHVMMMAKYLQCRLEVYFRDCNNVSHDSLAEFDRQFTVKEKCVKPSHVLFNMLVSSCLIK
jgi:hypothetical protein